MERELKHALVLLGGFMAVLLAVFVVKSSWEAASYNRLTGANVSTWDAMWLELRIESTPTPERLRP